LSALGKPSAVEAALSLRKQAEDLLRDAKQEALDKALKAIADLNDLGFMFQLLEGDEPYTANRGRYHYRVVDINKSQPSIGLTEAIKLAQRLSQEHPGRELIVEKVERVWPNMPVSGKGGG
jgi:hypothetical protein